MEVSELLSLAISRNASDIHLISDYSPSLRIDGVLKPMVTFPNLTNESIEQMIFACLNPSQKELFINNKEIDFSTVYQLNDGTKFRFRGNAYYQKGTMAASFRLIPSKIKSIQELNLPDILNKFTQLREGFVLLTGPSGQGKSTTIASMIQVVNENRSAHIISIEDPIEYEFGKSKSLVSQREMFQ